MNEEYGVQWTREPEKVEKEIEVHNAGNYMVRYQTTSKEEQRKQITKTKKELNALKEEIESINKKLNDNEIEKVSGGTAPDLPAEAFTFPSPKISEPAVLDKSTDLIPKYKET